MFCTCPSESKSLPVIALSYLFGRVCSFMVKEPHCLLLRCFQHLSIHSSLKICCSYLFADYQGLQLVQEKDRHPKIFLGTLVHSDMYAFEIYWPGNLKNSCQRGAHANGFCLLFLKADCLQEMKQLVKSKNRDLDISGSQDYCCRYTWTSKCQQELVLEVEVAMQPQLCGLQTRWMEILQVRKSFRLGQQR